MKLRNKKTGEIVRVVFNNDETYDTLAEFNEVWEDYEEPKEYWYIRGDDSSIGFSPIGNCEVAKRRKEIGNYFESEEEAEKAVEKLKAWKQLKDKGFRFEAWYGGSKNISFSMPQELIGRATVKDLNLLFGGEE